MPRRRRHKGGRSDGGGRVVALITLGAVVVFAPQLMAGTTAPTSMAIAVVAPIAALMAAWAFHRHAPRHLDLPVIAFGLVAGLVLIQALPLPIRWVDALYPQASEMVRDVSRLLDVEVPSTASLSLAPLATRRELAEGLAILSVFWAAWAASRAGDRGHVVRISGLAILGVAFVSLAHAIIDLRRPFGIMPEPHWNPAFIGPILNQNQLGGLLAAGVPVLIASGLEEEAPSRRAPFMIAAAGLAIMTVFCQSRGAILSLAVGIGVLVVLTRWRRPRDPRITLLWVGAGIAAMVGGAAFAAVGDAMIEETARGLPKLELFRQSLDVIANAPWTGVGRGAFSAAFVRLYGSDERPEHPENLPIEWAAEIGVPVALAVLGLLAVAWFRAARSARSPAQLGALAAVFSLCVHDLFDFALEMVGTAVVGACLLGAALAPSKELDISSPESRRISPAMVGVVAFVISIIVVHPVVELAVPRLRDEMVEALRTEDWERLEELNTRAVAAHPSEPVFPLLFGHGAAAQNRPDALRWLTRAMHLAPEWYQPHESAARWLLRRGALEQAFLEVREVRRRASGRAFGVGCAVAARPGAARFALRIFERDFEFLESIVSCATPSDASLLDEYLAAAGRVGPLVRQARAHLAARDPEAALRVLERARDDARVVMVRADALAAVGRHEEALSILAARLQNEPTSALRERFARAQVAMGDGPGMRQTLEEVLQHGDGSSGAIVRQRMLLASLEEALGDRMRALSALEDAHTIDPNGPALREIIRLATALGDTARVHLGRAELCRRGEGEGAVCPRPGEFFELPAQLPSNP